MRSVSVLNCIFVMVFHRILDFTRGWISILASIFCPYPLRGIFDLHLVVSKICNELSELKNEYKLPFRGWGFSTTFAD
jgi:hypothetical protein